MTLAILGIVTAIGAPSLGNYISSNRVSTEASRIASVLRYARSEAVTRNAAVVVRAESASDWSSSIQVYVDASGGDSAYDDSEDTLLKSFPAGYENLLYDGNGKSNDGVTFDPQARLDETNAVIIAVCDKSYTYGRKLTVNLVGRVIVEELASPSNSVGSCKV